MAKPGRGSYVKGANFERKIAKLLSQKFGVDVKRTGAQESAKVHGGDVNTHRGNKSVLNDFFWECKAREQWDLIGWLKKAQDDEGLIGRPAVVVATRNNQDDYVFLKFSDFLNILQQIDMERKKEV